MRISRSCDVLASPRACAEDFGELASEGSVACICARVHSLSMNVKRVPNVVFYKTLE